MSSPTPPKMEFDVVAVRLSARASEARCKQATIALDTDMAGNLQAFNPAELLLAALAACMIKGIERVAPILRFQLRGVEVVIHGIRQDAPPKMARIEYLLTIDTDESDTRLELLHTNVMKYGTVYNTLTAGTELGGRIRRAGTA